MEFHLLEETAAASDTFVMTGELLNGTLLEIQTDCLARTKASGTLRYGCYVYEPVDVRPADLTAVEISFNAVEALTISGTTGEAVGVSSNGLIIVGNAWTPGVNYGAHYWDADRLAHRLDEPAGTKDNTTWVSGLSADGTVAVGRAMLADSQTHAVSWTIADSAATILSESAGISDVVSSEAVAASADGSVIAGFLLDKDDRYFAVQWSSGVCTALSEPAACDRSVATCISPDGTRIGGQTSDDSTNLNYAVVWVSGVRTQFGDGIDPDHSTMAAGVSDTGMVVGVTTSLGGAPLGSWVYSILDALTTPLDGIGSDWVQAKSVSQDGRIVTGSAKDANNIQCPVIWVDGGVMLPGVLTNDVASYVGYAWAVSADLKVAVGGEIDASLATTPVVWQHS